MNTPASVPLEIRLLNFRGTDRERLTGMPRPTVLTIRRFAFHRLLSGSTIASTRSAVLSALRNSKLAALEGVPYRLPQLFLTIQWTAQDLRALAPFYVRLGDDGIRHRLLVDLASVYRAASCREHPQAARVALAAAANSAPRDGRTRLATVEYRP